MFKPKAAIFDFDGTLADSMWVWDQIDREFLEKRGIPYSEEYAETIAVLGFEGGADYVIEHFGLDEDPEDIIEEWKSMAEEHYATEVKMKPQVVKYLRRLSQEGVPLAIATSLQRHLLDPSLHNNGIIDLLPVRVVCDELQCNGKSTPAPYLEAARQLGVAPEDCVVFEDVHVAAASAKRGGMYVIGVYDPHKQQHTEELKAVCDRFIMSFEELLA